MAAALQAEEQATRAGQALTIIAQNIDQAASCEGPICQDTGMPTFEIKVPVGANQIWMKQRVRAAIAEATKRGKLRPNSVDSITGENSGDNLGPGTPIAHFYAGEQEAHEGELILEGAGGGGEGGGRGGANWVAGGPMGFGGKAWVIGCKIGALNRLPASFFVSIAYDCWAFRRLGVTLDARSGAITSWLYREGETASVPMLTPEQLAAGFPRTGREIRLQAPVSEDQIRALKVGDVVLVSGRAYTGRDAVHAHLMKHDPPVDLRGSVLYHCGPVVAKEKDTWKVMAAGPTTSIREEPYQAEILKRYGVRVVIGKGGMGDRKSVV